MNLSGFFCLTTCAIFLSSTWKEKADHRIEEIRKGDFVVTVLNADSKPFAKTPIRIRQTRHDFKFGVCLDGRYIGRGTEDSQKYESFILEHFNAAVCEDAMNWTSIEKSENETDFSEADKLVEFAQKNNMPMRGHCLLWGVKEHVQNWLQFLTPQETRRAITRHLGTMIPRYKDKVSCWEVENEMLDGHYYVNYLDENARVYFFQKTKLLDKKTPLFTNEYGILSDDAKTANYISLIKRLNQEGAEVDGIGIQEHSAERFVFDDKKSSEKSTRSPLNPEDILRRLDALGKLGLPVHITELSFRSENEDKKAEALENCYRLLFSHPSVEAIFLWGFWEKNHWMGREAALVNENWDLLPAGKNLHRLILYEWNTMLDSQTDEIGQTEFRGFYGDYKIFVDMPSGERLSGIVHLDPATTQATVYLNIEK